MRLKPREFGTKWKRAKAHERQPVQEHFLDLCGLAGRPDPEAFRA